MYLFHYYDKQVGPFVSLSDLPITEVKAVLEDIKVNKPGNFSAKRNDAYMERRHEIEAIQRAEFAQKGGIIQRKSPHYMTIGPCSMLAAWYIEAHVWSDETIECYL